MLVLYQKLAVIIGLLPIKTGSDSNEPIHDPKRLRNTLPGALLTCELEKQSLGIIQLYFRI